MYDIVIVIITIPLSLKYFSDKVKKRPALWRWKTLSAIQEGILLATVYVEHDHFGTIPLNGLSGNMNFFWLTVVLLIAFLFCKPSYVAGDHDPASGRGGG